MTAARACPTRGAGLSVTDGASGPCAPRAGSVRAFAAVCLAVAALCAGCAPKVSKPSGAGAYKVGRPYQINGRWYHPREDYTYDRTGIASWYGPGFHGKTTANGEIFNQHDISAAHPTLPMPSIARVTNLDNGRSITVRINDRGPFANDRVIDLSKGAAHSLGFVNKGTTRVRVRILAAESRAAKVQAMGGRSGPVTGPVTVSSPWPSQADRPRAVETAARTVANAVLERAGLSWIQVGAFASRENAERLSRSLGSLGNSLVSEGRFGDHSLYRVRLGPFESTADAQRVLSHVRVAGYPDARIMTD
ncbi:septal ring lytic transglycosylase RlpA family protein [Phaeovibrio sulfidiphilus]|uniref:Endolytic peptidoglycan transglycosylase RlpA n=1 Tax=Phaeovibrio sulfidiphilus TaxID=1220600 RepID=A0A8J6YQ53_9PROT|nr:septal ring lytic transglycosylase RlpA family protein [Phaeovibrio sulfidiphilus]MBE1237661.1 septal ring lytic transglycosylase RlpA family protein [Phaeovibrio sulfidiphilus]